VIAQTGFQFDISTAQGKLLASFMVSLAEFERDLLKERVRSSLAGAKARGKALGRQVGDRPKSDKLAPKVIKLFNAGTSYRKIAGKCELSVNTVRDIFRRSSSKITSAGR
jgi:DNA invertase Pin-like site-specific DNA recombinase